MSSASPSSPQARSAAAAAAAAADADADAPATGGRAPQAAVFPLSWAGVGVAALFALLAASAISPFFKTSFPVLLGRTLLLALVLLAVFYAAVRLPERLVPVWLPRWLPPTLAVAVAAPLTTLLIYAATLGGDVAGVFASMPHQWGFWITAGTALALGLVVTLTAQLRQREAQARASALQFALERSRLEKQALDARLALLQAQIEPHFLFNTLANVQALVEAGAPQAQAVLRSLIAYLRAAMPRLHDGAATLEQELGLVRAYLELMALRMPDRLSFSLEAEPELLSQPFPPLALLTLVENAVRHGIDPLEQGGRIEVRAQQQGRSWFVQVRDDGVGMDPRSAPGLGLTNLRERLAGCFGPQARLQLEAGQPRGLVARLCIPTRA